MLKFQTARMDLNREDEFLIRLARTGVGEPEWGRALELLEEGMDLDRVLESAARNRLSELLFFSLDRLDLLSILPAGIRRRLEARYRRTVINTRVYLEEAGALAEDFEKRGLPLIVLRGPALGIAVYGRPYLRPFADLDLLIRREDLSAAKEVLRRRGYASPAGLFPERYFERHHLHLRLGREDRGTVIELHWALDHPFTLHTVEYASLFQRARPAEYSGTAIPVLCPEDRLLTLCLHFVKHCPFLAALSGESDFPPLLLRGRLLIWLLDIHESLCRTGDELEWESVRFKANAWGLKKELVASLRAVRRVYSPSVFPEHAWLPCGEGVSEIRTNFLERRAGRAQLALLRGEGEADRSARFLFALRPDSIFRPVRALDFVRYLLPPLSYMRRRYGASGAAVILRYPLHAGSALLRMGGNLLDYVRSRIAGRSP